MKSLNKVLYDYELWLYPFLSFFAVIFLFYTSEQASQTLRDLHAYRALIIFEILILAYRTPKLKQVGCFIGIVLFGYLCLKVVFYLRNISPATYGVDYYRVVKYLWLVIIIFLALLIDSILFGSIPDSVKQLRWPFWVYIIAVVISSISGKRVLVPLLCPITALYMSSMSEMKWKKAIDGLALGYLGAFVFLMSRSLIVAPHVMSDDNRYLGTFLNIGSTGMYAAGAICCSFWLILKKKQNIGVKILEFSAFAFASFSLYIIGSRGCWLGVLSAVLLVGFVCIYKFRHKMKEISLSKYLLVALIVGIGILLLILIKGRVFNNNDDLDNDKSYLSFRGSYLINSDYSEQYYYSYDNQTWNSCFEYGSYLNNIDRFASGRLTVYYASLKQVGFWGHSYRPIYLMYNNVSFGGTTSPHCFPLFWCIEYGIIGGLCFVWVFIWGLVWSIRETCRGSSFAIISMVWISCAFVTSLTLTVNWFISLIFLSVFFMYPFMRKVSLEVHYGNNKEAIR